MNKNRDLLDYLNTGARVVIASASVERARIANERLKIAKSEKKERSEARKLEFEIKAKELQSREQERNFNRQQKEDEKQEKNRTLQVKSAFAKYISGIYINCSCGDAHPFSFIECPACKKVQYLDELTIRTIVENLENACDILESEETIADILLKEAPLQFKAYLSQRRRFLEDKSCNENLEREKIRSQLTTEMNAEIKKITAAKEELSPEIKNLANEYDAYERRKYGFKIREKKANTTLTLISERQNSNLEHKEYRSSLKKYIFLSVLSFSICFIIIAFMIHSNDVVSHREKSILIKGIAKPLMVLFALSFLRSTYSLITLKKPISTFVTDIDESTLSAMESGAKAEIESAAQSLGCEPSPISISMIPEGDIAITKLIQEKINNYEDPFADGLITPKEASEIMSSITAIEKQIESSYLKLIDDVCDIEGADFVDEWHSHFLASTLSERIIPDTDIVLKTKKRK